MSDHSAKTGEKLMLIKTITMAAAKQRFFRRLKNQKNLLPGLTK